MKVRTEPVDKKLDIQYLVAVPMQMVLHILRSNSQQNFSFTLSGGIVDKKYF